MALAVILSSPHGSSAESPGGLLADWRFRDGCIDQSGNGLNGQMGGFKIAEEPGTATRCAFNDGSQPKGVWMTVPDSPVFKRQSALTVVFEVKCLPSNTTGWLLYKTSPEGCDFGILFDTGPIRIENKKDSYANYRIGLKIATVTKWFLVNRKQHPPTEWNRFAVTVDLKGDRIPRLYIDGKRAAQSDSFGLDDFYSDENGDRIGTVDFYEFTGSTLPCNGMPLCIGGANIIKENSFQGYIGEIMLFGRCLSNDELN